MLHCQKLLTHAKSLAFCSTPCRFLSMNNCSSPANSPPHPMVAESKQQHEATLRVKISSGAGSWKLCQLFGHDSTTSMATFQERPIPQWWLRTCCILHHFAISNPPFCSLRPAPSPSGSRLQPKRALESLHVGSLIHLDVSRELPSKSGNTMRNNMK